MKKTILTIIFAFILINVKAQAPNWAWAKGAGGTSPDFCYSTATDVNGNVYITGKFSSPTITFGAFTLTNNGGGWSDIFIVKYDPNGNVLWAKSEGDSYGEKANSITTDTVGNVIIISSNGVNWTTSKSTVPNTLYGICWSEELSMFVAVSNSSTTNKVLTSVDGINWTIIHTPGDCQLRTICWSPELNLFVAGGGSSSTYNNIMASSDGINWSLCNTLINGSTFTSICWSPEKMLFIAVSPSTSNTFTVSSSIFSNDGYNWTMFKDTYSIIGGTVFSCVCWAKDINMFLSIEINNNLM